mmetsp:Transcript_123712/g.309211  ORF Transcript_123712/g.309211 Transcript_123712/m.309211 type:complete len:259 (+) Transcript_123712:371-1147(+)
MRKRAWASRCASVTRTSTSGRIRFSASRKRSSIALSNFCSASRILVTFSAANFSSASLSFSLRSSSASLRAFSVACAASSCVDSSVFRNVSAASVMACARAFSNLRVASLTAASALLMASPREGKPEIAEELSTSSPSSSSSLSHELGSKCRRFRWQRFRFLPLAPRPRCRLPSLPRCRLLRLPLLPLRWSLLVRLRQRLWLHSGEEASRGLQLQLRSRPRASSPAVRPNPPPQADKSPRTAAVKKASRYSVVWRVGS